MASDTDPWHISIDTGGTFTDCLGRDPQGRLHRAKVLSTGALRGRVLRRVDERTLEIQQHWSGGEDVVGGFAASIMHGGAGIDAGIVARFDAQRSLMMLDRPLKLHDAVFETQPTIELHSDEPAPILAARLITRTSRDQPLPPMKMRLATTRGTNALLERKGAPTALFITQGFGDLLLIGDQQRPEIFARHIVKPPPLYEAVVEVPERLNADGTVLRSLNLEDVETHAKSLLAKGIRSAAVALLHSYRNPDHEHAIVAMLQRVGFTHISCSSDLAPLIKILPRAQTAVVDAYLGPVIGEYLCEVSSRLDDSSLPARAKPQAASSLHVLTSAGGLVRAEHYRASASLLSGPAGGVAGAAAVAKRSGFQRIIGFDMGGTSTDVARFDGDFDYRFEHTVAGAKLMAPALNIETVAAGGGSICDFVDDQLIVGPHSAGANPGPACYGAGGPLTLTDVNLLLGRLDESRFEIPVSRAASERALDELLTRMAGNVPAQSQAAEVLEGFLEIANQRMAAAIEQISIRQGYDPREYALVAFGGAGGQHACAVAELLGIETVILPEDASLLSALGLGESVIERFAQRQVLMMLDECHSRLPVWLNELAWQAMYEVEAEGVPRECIAVRRRIVNLRLKGQDFSLATELAASRDGDFEISQVRDQFRGRYRATYGHAPSDSAEIEVDSIRVVASDNAAHHSEASSSPVTPNPGRASVSPEMTQAVRSIRMRADRQWIESPVFERDQLHAGDTIRGPAVIIEQRTALVIESNWSATIDGAGALIVKRASSASSTQKAAPASSVVDLEIFTHRLTSIAIEMGRMLERVAVSTNVKERLDFSCAVLDADGELVVNAPHLPVHLGALGVCVRTVRDVIAMHPGDVIITNHPAFGGSHLPDVTVITPVFADSKTTIGEGLSTDGTDVLEKPVIPAQAGIQSVARIAPLDSRLRGNDGGDFSPSAPSASSADACSPPVDVLIGHVASRAHHAEIGGTRPGSMPPGATTLVEEGVVIPPRYLIERGESRFESMEKLLRESKYPSRAVADNLADLRAAVAANQRGVDSLRGLATRHGINGLKQRMEAIKSRSERLMREAIARLPDDRCEAVERLDDGSPIHIMIEKHGDGCRIDFTGSAAQHPGNLNATPAIVRAAVMYVLRLLIGRDLPLNEGLMRAVELVIPRGMLDPRFELHDPAKCPAVVGGNTETSQRIVDTLLKALQLSACSQGTMNNLLFGTDRFGYYETICGGAGAGPDFPGADAVHTHMTNTRITDAEIIEHRYPVRLERFAIRHGSGGEGKYRGGDGAIREITFLQSMSLSLLSQHRIERPFGLRGGSPGMCGRQRLVRTDGSIDELKGIDALDVGPGDRLILETPGGGACGERVNGTG